MRKNILRKRRSVFPLVIPALIAVLFSLPAWTADDDDGGRGKSKGRIKQLEADVNRLSNRVDVQQQLIESLQTDLEEVTGIFTQPGIVFVDSVTIEEGGSLAVSVALSKPSVYQVLVDYGTSDGTGIAGQHYEAAFGTLVFEPGSTVQEISIDTIDNYNARSPTVDFQINLSNAVYAELGASTISASIVDTEDKPFLVIYYTTAYEPSADPGSPAYSPFTARYQLYDGLKFPGLCRLDYSPYQYVPPEPVRISIGIDQSRLGWYPAAEFGVDFEIPETVELPAGISQGTIDFGQVTADNLVEGPEYVWFDAPRTVILGEAVLNRYCSQRVTIVDSD